MKSAILFYLPNDWLSRAEDIVFPHERPNEKTFDPIHHDNTSLA